VLPPSEARGRYLSSPAPRGAKIPFSAGSMGTLVASARTIEGASDSDRKSNIKSNGQTLSGQQSASTAWAMPSETKKAPEHKVVPYDEVRDPGWMMLLPLVLFVAAMLVIGLHPEPLIDAFTQIASALG
ncbi:MAG: hypothetical protein LUG99_07045, partial [Lachnospiraceae bacterium]|nr:hypothetical protein [Lachnospiraceae bacterium]